MKKLLLVLFISSIFLAMFACKRKSYNTYKNTVGIPPAEFAMMDTPNYTTIKMYNLAADFGTIKQGDSAIMEYRYKNTGDNMLFFGGVYTSCGCTVPRYSTEPLEPGKEAIFKAVYRSNDDTGFVHKTIKIHTNTSNGIERILKFQGYVTPK